VQTVDFFTPVVDDARLFGRIAAANALSDIYAMNAKPLTALNILCWPKDMEEPLIRQVLEGALEALQEAEGLLVGGHTVEDAELKFGFAVTGIGDEGSLWRADGARPNCALILTKPIGTGVIATAIKGGLAEAEWIEAAQKTMATLNRSAQEALSKIALTATDVTGFGLLGHLITVAEPSGVTAVLDGDAVPLLEGARECASMGLIPEGLYRNRNFYANKVKFKADTDEAIATLLFDPQTSGGLILFVPQEKADDALSLLKDAGVKEAALIGRTVEWEGIPVLVQ